MEENIESIEDTFTVPWEMEGDLEINCLRSIDYVLSFGVDGGLDAETLDRMRNWISSKMAEYVLKASVKQATQSE